MEDSTVSRRTVLGAAGAGVMTAALAGLAATPAAARPQPPGRGRPERQRPNIVWLLSEDNNPYIGAYGDSIARTPTLDRLADEGVLFEVAYSPAPVCAPSRFGFLTGMYAESCGPAHHMRAVAKMPEEIRGFPEYLRENGYYCTNSSKTDYNADIDMEATWDESSGSAHWRNRPDADTPFFAQFTMMANHESSLFQPTEGEVKPQDVTVPPFLPDTPEIRVDIASSYNRMAIIDGQIAARLQELEDDGLLEDTVVFYFGDNGGALAHSKRFANERGLRIPLIIKVPDKWAREYSAQPGRRISAPVHGVDFPATALTLAGITPPRHMQGRNVLGPRARRRDVVFGQRSRMDERYDLQRTARDERYVYTRNYMPYRPDGQYMAYMWQQRSYQVWEERFLEGTLTPEQTRFWQEKPYEQLFDLRRDPHQIDNLVGKSSARGTLRELSRALDAHILDVNDNGFIPEGLAIEGYEESRAPGAYPLRRVMDVAERAARRDPASLSAHLRDLGDGHAVVRYWAAQGVLGLGADARDVARDLHAVLHEETVDQVRVPVAEALARLGHTSASGDYLAQTVDTHPNGRVRLQALNAMTHLGLLNAEHRAVVERAAGSSDEYLRNAGKYLLHRVNGTYEPTVPVFSFS